MEKVAFSRVFNVEPNSEVFETIYTVSSAKVLDVEEIAVSFPVSTMYQLRVYFYNGEIMILPTDPNFPITGENVTVTFKNPFSLFSNERLRIRLVNTSTTETRTCIVKVEGIIRWEYILK